MSAIQGNENSLPNAKGELFIALLMERKTYSKPLKIIMNGN